ncbi:MAG: type II secretion system minor pseudopilin GspJ [Pseudomonadota bacterium]
MSIRQAAGFTLIEVLIAMSIGAVIAAIAFVTLQQTSETAVAVSEQMGRLQAIQRTLQTIQRDFSQLSPRPVREELADRPSPVLSASGRSDYLVELTRGGWSNPLNMPRPGLMRVAYSLVDEELIRLQWPVLDRTLGTEPQALILLDGVTGIQIRFLPSAGDWVDVWPNNTGNVDIRSLRLRPRAAEIIIETDDYGELRRLIEVTG